MKKIMLIAIITIGGFFAMTFSVFSSGLGLFAVENEVILPMAGTEEIQVSMTSENIHVYKVENDSDIRFHYYGKSFPARSLVTEMVNGKLIIKPDAKYWIGDLKLDIYLPANYTSALSIKNSSGDVAMQAVDLSQFRLETTSGDFKADQINAPTVSFQTTTGVLTAMSIETGNLNISTRSGNLIFGKCNAENIIIRASSADVLLVSFTGNADIKTTSGKVNLIYPEFVKSKLNIKTTSGAINLKLPANAGFSLEAQTTSGTIFSDFVLQKKEKHEASGQIGAGVGQINLSATSGNIGITIMN